MAVFTMRDGRTLIGSVASETERSVTLRVIGQGDVVINKSEIQSQEVSGNSLMPEGLLRTLTDDEVVALIAYLKTNEQVPAGDE